MARPTTLSYLPGLVKVRVGDTWYPLYEIPTGDSTVFGVVSLSDSIDSGSAEDGVAATPQAVRDAISDLTESLNTLPTVNKINGRVLKVDQNGNAAWMTDNDTILSWVNL